MKHIRVFLIDDHSIVRQGFQSLLSREDDIEVVGEASGGEEAINKLSTLRADIVVMDIQMQPINGIITAERVLRKHPKMKILILSMHEDSVSVRQAIQLGVAGYLVKSTVMTELLTAIREIYKGNAYFSPSVQKMLIELNDHPSEPQVELTVRDQELLELIGLGQTNKDIASVFGISIKTVDKYRQHLMNKLSIHDVAGLTRYAIERGIIKLK